MSILIGLWIYDEISFDKGIPHYDRIAGVLQNQNLSGGVATWRGQAKQLAPALRKDYGSLFKYVVTSTGANVEQLSYGDKRLRPTGAFMDPDAPSLLSLEMLQGSRTSLQGPSSIVLSASLAKSIFGSEDPMGKTLKLDTQAVLVRGVYADLPLNSSFADFQFIAPFELLESRPDIKTLNWGNSWFNTDVQLNDNVDLAAASRAIKMVKARYSEGDRRFKPELFLFPLDRWHLYSDFKNGASVGGRIQYVRLYAVIGIFVLFLACINFMNLSTARSEKRAKEVGIRKAIGSQRGQLVRQFFGESVLAGGVWFHPGHRPRRGSYPALYLSSFRPVKVLKGTFRVGRLAALPRRVLVVVQFTVSIVLIIGTIVVFRQIQYVKDRPVGYSRAGLVMVSIQTQNVPQHLDAIRNQLLQTGLVQEVAASESDPPNSWITNMGYTWPGKDPSIQEEFTSNGVSTTFGNVVGWRIKEGRDFAPNLLTDSNAFIINEAAVKYMNLTHPLGKIMTWGDNQRFTIIGVVKDMVVQSPYEPVNQMIFHLGKNRILRTLDIRLKPQASMSKALEAISGVIKQYDSENTFEYRIADEEYAKKFGDEERIVKLAGFFTILAILISCLGLLGLSAFVAEQRVREIGVRKVLGATVFHLWNLQSREFIRLVGLSLLIGGPVAYWFMHRWLDNYAYHAGLSWWIFAAAAFGALSLTLLTVSYQGIKAALANPVRSLRTE